MKYVQRMSEGSSTLNDKQQAFENAFSQGDLPGAERALAALEETQAKKVFTKVAKARVQVAHGNVAGALITLRHIVRQKPKSGYARAYYGGVLVADGKFIKAISQLKTALTQGGDTPSARHSLGAALVETGKPEEAIEHLESSIARLEQPSTCFYLGVAYEQLNHLDKAEEAYGRCCELEPRYEGAIASLVRAQALQGKFKAAKSTIESGLEIYPEDQELIRFLVQVNFDLGDREAAKQILESLPKDARDVEDVCNLVMLAIDDKRFEDAVNLTEEAEELDQAHWRPPYLRGLALEGQNGAYEEIVTSYEQAIGAGDPYGEAGTRLGFILLTGDNPTPASAVSVLEDAARRNNQAPGTLLNLALACEKNGDAVRATELANAVSVHPTRAMVTASKPRGC